MRKKPSEEEMDKIMKLLENGLNGIMGDFATVKAIKSPMTNHIIETYMKYPIMTLTITRNGCERNISMCDMDDLIAALPHAIGVLLGTVPEKYRNDILAEAIQMDMPHNGIYDEEENNK